MNVRPERLAEHLAQRGPKPAYLLAGEEPLQREESLDTIARTTRCIARVRLPGTDLGAVEHEVQAGIGAPSLFGDRSLVCVDLLRVPSARDAKRITALLDHLHDDLFLVVILRVYFAARLKRAGWITTLSQIGDVVDCANIRPSDMPAWCARRARLEGITLTPDAPIALAHRTEGNLLDCVQFLRLLPLAYPGETIDAQRVDRLVDNQSHFAPFDLIEPLLNGDPQRIVHMLARMRSDGAQPIAVLGAIAWILREMHALVRDLSEGRPLAESLSKPTRRALKMREPAVRRAVDRLHRTSWMKILAGPVCTADRIMKGATTPVGPWRGTHQPGQPMQWSNLDAWVAIERVALTVCKVPVPTGIPV